MNEDSALKIYRELSISQCSYSRTLKQIRKDLNRIKYPFQSRKSLLHEEQRILEMKQSVDLSIEKMADNLDSSMLKQLGIC